MKIKHNKKRNTAFLYESLVKEITKNIISEDGDRKKKAIRIMKEHFSPGTVLRKELDLYRNLYESSDLDRPMCEKIMKQVRAQRATLPEEDIFASQTSLINDINRQLSASVYSNFIPNYKTIASISQMFNGTANIKNTIILENEIVDYMSKASLKEGKDLKPIDNLVLNTFVGNFNERYSEGLLGEQRELLNYYITSFSDNGVNLKMFLNEELGRLKEELRRSLKLQEISADSNMSGNIEKVVSNLNSLAKIQISEDMIRQVLKVQSLVREISE